MSRSTTLVAAGALLCAGAAIIAFAYYTKHRPAPVTPFTQAQVVAMDAACTAAGGVLTVGDSRTGDGITLDRVERMLCAKRPDVAGTLLPASTGATFDCRREGEYPTSSGECLRPGATRDVTSEGAQYWPARPSYNAADCRAVLNTTWLECRGAVTGEVYYYGPGDTK